MQYSVIHVRNLQTEDEYFRERPIKRAHHAPEELQEDNR